jgi:hypothetical protein
LRGGKSNVTKEEVKGYLEETEVKKLLQEENLLWNHSMNIK